MSHTRSTAILLTTVALLTPGAAASAASKRLTSKPPGGLSRGKASVRAEGKALPYTGIDLPLEMLTAASLLAAGGALRRKPAGD
jgi:hypothetical protein